MDFAVIVAATVEFADGDAAIKTISVTLADDDEVEADETFTVLVSAPTSGATMSNPVGTVTITDDDKARQDVIFGDSFELPQDYCNVADHAESDKGNYSAVTEYDQMQYFPSTGDISGSTSYEYTLTGRISPCPTQ